MECDAAVPSSTTGLPGCRPADAGAQGIHGASGGDSSAGEAATVAQARQRSFADDELKATTARQVSGCERAGSCQPAPALSLRQPMDSAPLQRQLESGADTAHTSAQRNASKVDGIDASRRDARLEREGDLAGAEAAPPLLLHEGSGALLFMPHAPGEHFVTGSPPATSGAEAQAMFASMVASNAAMAALSPVLAEDGAPPRQHASLRAPSAHLSCGQRMRDRARRRTSASGAAYREERAWRAGNRYCLVMDGHVPPESVQVRLTSASTMHVRFRRDQLRQLLRDTGATRAPFALRPEVEGFELAFCVKLPGSVCFTGAAEPAMHRAGGFLLWSMPKAVVPLSPVT